MRSKWLNFRIKKLKFWIKLLDFYHKKKKKGSCKILNLSFYLPLLWMCSKWLIYRIKKLHFWMGNSTVPPKKMGIWYPLMGNLLYQVTFFSQLTVPFSHYAVLTSHVMVLFSHLMVSLLFSHI